MTTAPAPLVGLDEIRSAAAHLEGVVVRTPLLPSPELAEGSGAAEVRLKCENLQRGGAFKARGGIHFLAQRSDDEIARGVITYSSGNHAQAVALAALLRGVRAVVVMPTTAPGVKVEGARRLGAEVVFAGTTSLERLARAESIADDDGLLMVPPFDEIVEEWPEVDTILVPIGGGGLASGVAAAARRLRPGVRVVGVEPEGAASMTAALEAGGPVTLAATSSIADGLLPVRAGTLTWRHFAELGSGVVTVDDEGVREATRMILHRHRMVVEFSGAATVAALRAGSAAVAGERVAVVLSGGNLDPAFLTELA